MLQTENNINSTAMQVHYHLKGFLKHRGYEFDHIKALLLLLALKVMAHRQISFEGTQTVTTTTKESRSSEIL